MSNRPRSKSTDSSPRRPRTRLRIKQLLKGHSASDLADAMGIRFYTQVYRYLGSDVNPTLLALEEIADGLSQLLKRRISVSELLDERAKK